MKTTIFSMILWKLRLVIIKEWRKKERKKERKSEIYSVDFGRNGRCLQRPDTLSVELFISILPFDRRRGELRNRIRLGCSSGALDWQIFGWVVRLPND